MIYAKNFSQYAIAYKKPTRGGSATPIYKITVTQSEGGKISPETVSITKNSSKTFIITPNEGYEVEDVLVNSKRIGSANISDYAKEAVAFCTKQSIPSGKDSIFSPQDYATRAEVAVILERAFKIQTFHLMSTLSNKTP